MRRDESGLIRARMGFVAYTMVTFFLVLVAGFWHFQMAQSRYYVDLADKNRFKQITIIAKRGQILDREGRVLVDSRPSFNVVLIRENMTNSLEQTIAMLAPGIHMNPEELRDRVYRKRSEPKFRPIALKEDVDVADIAFVKAHEIPGVTVEDQSRRRYPGEIAAHAVGYVGEVTPEELKRPEYRQYKSGDLVGKTGLERQYNAILRGKDGYRRVVVDNHQKEVQKLGEELPIAGNDIRTTIDLDLQRAAEEAIGDQVGAAIAIDPITGEVLVLASKPSYDPNIFTTTVTPAVMQALLTDPRKPFRNRVIQDHYSPGSVFKVFMTVAGLESETLSPLDHYNCAGVAEVLPGVTKHCWKAGGHGPISLYEALVHSCNIFFYNVGKKMDIDKIAMYAKQMGLGRPSGIDLAGEDAGLMPSREWKAHAFQTKSKAEQAWRQADTLNVAIGQGQLLVTPIQAAWAMGGLTSGGRLMQPHLVNPEQLKKSGFKAQGVKEENYQVGAETLDIVRNALWGVVNSGGTGTAAAVKGFDVAGKTGTAQVIALDAYKNKKKSTDEEDLEDNAWFVGFAPYRNPEIVVATFVEHGGHGGVTAAPVAHAIFDTFYRKRTGQFAPAGSGQLAQLKK